MNTGGDVNTSVGPIINVREMKNSETQTNRDEMRKLRTAANIGKNIGQTDSDEYSEEDSAMPEGNKVHR